MFDLFQAGYLFAHCGGMPMLQVHSVMIFLKAFERFLSQRFGDIHQWLQLGLALMSAGKYPGVILVNTFDGINKSTSI